MYEISKSIFQLISVISSLHRNQLNVWEIHICVKNYKCLRSNTRFQCLISDFQLVARGLACEKYLILLRKRYRLYMITSQLCHCLYMASKYKQYGCIALLIIIQLAIILKNIAKEINATCSYSYQYTEYKHLATYSHAY